MLNQGVYNLMLAVGAGLGAALATSPEWGGAARAIGGFSAACMVGAALTLLASAPQMFRGALIQGVAPAAALVGLWLG
jgi:putative membrane protein